MEHGFTKRQRAARKISIQLNSRYPPKGGVYHPEAKSDKRDSKKGIGVFDSVNIHF
jgi:hypothetical protein